MPLFILPSVFITPAINGWRWKNFINRSRTVMDIATGNEGPRRGAGQSSSGGLARRDSVSTGRRSVFYTFATANRALKMSRVLRTAVLSMLRAVFPVLGTFPDVCLTGPWVLLGVTESMGKDRCTLDTSVQNIPVNTCNYSTCVTFKDAHKYHTHTHTHYTHTYSPPANIC